MQKIYHLEFQIHSLNNLSPWKTWNESLGLTGNSAEAIFLTMIPLLASAFPFTPSGAGVVEITMFSCLRVVGVTSPVAASLTVVNRFIDYALHIALGVLTWAIRRVIGLRTWRDVPLEDLHENDTAEIPVGREAFNRN